MTQFNSPSPDCTCLFPGRSHWEHPQEPSLIAGVREELLPIREPADDSKMTPHRQLQKILPDYVPPLSHMIEMLAGEELWRSLIQPPTQSRTAANTRSSQPWLCLLKTSRGGDPTTSLCVCSTHILLILFLGTYPSPKQLYSTSRTITSRCFAIHPTPCPSRTWWPRNTQEVEHLLWELRTLSLLFRTSKSPPDCSSSLQAGGTCNISCEVLEAPEVLLLGRPEAACCLFSSFGFLHIHENKILFCLSQLKAQFAKVFSERSHQIYLPQ